MDSTPSPGGPDFTQSQGVARTPAPAGSHAAPDLAAVIEPGWAQILAPVESRIHQLGDMLRQEARQGRGFLPAGTDVLRAFTYPFDQVKILLVGQDPYPTPGHPMGLSFSVHKGIALPKSLRNIFQELVDDLGVPWPSSGDLSPWCDQGVMLLNRVLTVRPGERGSHRGLGWEEVTSCAIDALNARNKPLVAILWGADAQTLKPQLSCVPCLESPHPSPLSAYKGFFGSRPFSRANQLLTMMGAEPVDWRLP